MDAAQAMSLVVGRIQSGDLDYPADDLTAERFDGGWCVYSPSVIADDPDEDLDEPKERSVFLVGGSGRVEQVSSSEYPEDARSWFQEACLWFSAEEPPGSRSSGAPSHPDLGASRPRQPRTATAYDRAALDTLAEALIQERDFAGWLAGRLHELGDLLGGSSRLITRRPRAWATKPLTELATAEDADGPTGVWRTWPAADPASLPDVDATGWVLVPGVVACEYLEAMESETDAATRLADVIADRTRPAPSWRACQVAELLPQLVALRRADLADADLATLRRIAAADGGEEFLATQLLTPDDPDVDALLRIAVDADRNHRDVIDIDAAATAAYRRVLDRLDLPFENYAWEAMFE
ncbi:MAG TPA: hypothetical protein VFW65_05790 [Pseudonocardiaceae bacterium]|nr:hypothetical protein [Pseudonocardiaceae bacterium]